jgi:hypothetical protein
VPTAAFPLQISPDPSCGKAENASETQICI